jgi:hypothetical protein
MRLLATIAGLTGATTLAAASLVLAAAPPAAAATGSPVSVTSCILTSVNNDGGNIIPATSRFHASDASISFVNQSPLTATDVRFAVSYAGSTQVLEDTGTFSSGTTITKNFTPSGNSSYNGPAECTVQSVTFSDGSSWQAM